MGKLLLIIFLSAIPSLIILFYFYRKDSKKKEPPILIWKLFFTGLIIVLPAAALELLLDVSIKSFNPLINSIIRAFLVAALVEEGLKLLAVRFFIYNNRAFDEITDGIIYTIATSLGFAFLENIRYSLEGGSVFMVLGIRAVTAVPLHALASGIMGYFIGLSKFRDRGYFGTGLVIAVLIHGLYDFFLFYGTWLNIHYRGSPAGLISFLIFPLLIICYWILKRLYSLATAEDQRAGRS